MFCQLIVKGPLANTMSDNAAGAGVGIVTLQLEPNATHLPHWHRGFELLFVINVSLLIPLHKLDNVFDVPVATAH